MVMITFPRFSRDEIPQGNTISAINSSDEGDTGETGVKDHSLCSSLCLLEASVIGPSVPIARDDFADTFSIASLLFSRFQRLLHRCLSRKRPDCLAMAGTANEIYCVKGQKGIVQGEQAKHKLWTDLPECLPDPQSFQVKDISLFELKGG